MKSQAAVNKQIDDEFREAFRSERRARWKKWTESHPGVQAARVKAWKDANREHVKEYSKAYAKTAVAKANQRAYRKRHPEVGRATAKRRRKRLHAELLRLRQIVANMGK